MTDLPQRKPNRLPSFDYSLPYLYFITICTAEKRHMLGRVVETSAARPAYVELSSFGKTVEAAILDIPKHYTAAEVVKYVVMPNHLHLLLWIRETGEQAPNVSRIIQQMKGKVTKELGASIWQKGFHDHVIRGRADYQEIWTYIENNPLKWTLDRYYREE